MTIRARGRASVALLAAATATSVVAGLFAGLSAGAATDDERAERASQRLGHQTLWRESFNGLAGEVAASGYTHSGPKGWSVEIAPEMSAGGVDDWRGWTFTTREHWVAAEDQMRHRFGRADDVIAVADSDEYDDAPGAADRYDTTLVSAPVRVWGHDAVELTFDSHLRPWTGQTATVTVEFDGSGIQTELLRYDSTNTVNNYDGTLANSTEALRVDVPQGVRQAVFRWRLDAPRNSWYWAVDSVSVRTTATPTPPVDEATSLWVVSDIQGHPGDLAHGLRDLSAVRPDAAGMLMVGDIVNSGTTREWQEIYDVMDGAQDIVPDEVVAAIGNHESYAGETWETLRDRFLQFASRDRVWDEYVISGAGGDVPVLVLGQEYPRPPEVGMSDEQVAWFESRLDHWTRQRKQVVVITHFPLGDTVSASWIPWYHDHHERNAELTAILGDHPNAILLTGHTHYPFELGDWAVQRRVPGGHPDGFTAVNTGAMHVEWDARGENTSGISEVVTRDINRGLTLDVYADRVVIEARDFGLPDASGDNDVNEVVRRLEITNPLIHGRPR
ncbi:metallophosphoesterase family protein [Jiangella gansuensis]|uniref:metallophosphoesterase family protein n=1 Tax=Jiangella gansuensis TaxID=281473 RepID=UPI001B7FD2FE|nr:DUF4073 domain-containing protein [Jiangella gansuensis]